MMNRWPAFVFLTAAVVWCVLPGQCIAQKYYAQPMADGTYKVTDPKTQRSMYVRDVRAWAAQRQYQNTGFGGELSVKEFQKGKSVVRDTVKITARTVDGVANTAVNSTLDAARFVPGWNRYSNGAREILHGGNRQAKR